MTKADYTHITVLIDRSGSMSDIRSDAQGGINTFIAEQQAQPGEASLALYSFDTEFKEEISPRPIAEASEFVLVPRGATALLDSMARAILLTGEWLTAKAEDARPGKVLFVVVTDGLENASREFTRQHVFNLVSEHREVYKWEFIFLAANQDAIAEARGYGISQASASNYAPTGQSVGRAFAAASMATTTYRGGPAGQGIVMPDDVDKENDED